MRRTLMIVAMVAVIAIPQMASASDILAGWYDFTGLDTVHLPTTGPGAPPDILLAGVAAEAWDGTSFRLRGGSNDNTFGTLAGAANGTDMVIRTRGGNGTDGGDDTLTFAITNNLTDTNLLLSGFNFDFGGYGGTGSPGNEISKVNLKYNSRLITTVTGLTSTTSGPTDYGDHDTSFDDITLAPGYTGRFTLIALDGNTGWDQHFDNIAIVGTTAAVPEPSPPNIIYGPLTYTDGDTGSQGGPYTFNANSRSISFTADNLDLSGPRAHSLTYDTGFSTPLSSYAVTTTHVSSSLSYDRRGLLGYAVDGVGAMGVWLYKDGYDVRYGSVTEAGAEESASRLDVLDAPHQVAGDGTSALNVASTFEITMDITDTGTDATSMFAYTFTQESNVWQIDFSFEQMITAAGATASDLIAAARDSGQSTGFAFYTFEGTTVAFDDTFVTTAAPVIPEPAGLGLLGLALLAVRRRRS